MTHAKDSKERNCAFESQALSTKWKSDQFELLNVKREKYSVVKLQSIDSQFGLILDA